VGVATVQPLDELGHSANLVAFDLEVGDERETVVDRRHGRERDATKQ
jgi:hypothetical protein